LRRIWSAEQSLAALLLLCSRTCTVREYAVLDEEGFEAFDGEAAVVAPAVFVGDPFFFILKAVRSYTHASTHTLKQKKIFLDSATYICVLSFCWREKPVTFLTNLSSVQMEITSKR